VGKELGCGASGPKRRREGSKRKSFPFFQTHSNHEFEQEFEFKHPKTMHQHVCNREFLYFIN
jgi:hypothetical protein